MNVFKRLKAGIAAHKKGRLKIAGNAYREVLAVEPDNPDALHFYGMLCHQRGDPEKAVTLIRKSLEANPGNPSAHNNLGNILVSMGNAAEAGEAYNAAIVTDPTLPESYHNLGILLRRAGKYDEASVVLQQAAELNERSPTAWNSLGICHMQMGNFEKAADAFEACTRLGFDDRLNPVWYGRILCALGREQSALKHFERYLSSNPDDVIAQHHAAAIRGEKREKVPESYVRQHFDEFADSFDETLEALEYRAPEIVAEELKAWHGDRPARPLALDLGCGTGLCGPLVAGLCERLIGVDLSPRMLFKAADAGAYHELHEADLVEFLEGLPADHVDFAVCADTLIYLGDLAPTMSALARALKPGGALVATLEEAADGETDGPGYRLQFHGRYSHTPAYLAAVTKDSGLEIVGERRAILRREANEDVPGLVVTIARPN